MAITRMFSYSSGLFIFKALTPVFAAIDIAFLLNESLWFAVLYERSMWRKNNKHIQVYISLRYEGSNSQLVLFLLFWLTF